MAHVSPEPPGWRRGSRIGGALLLLIGLAVAAVSIIALQHPNGRAAVAPGTVVITTTSTPSATTSATASGTPTTAPPSTGTTSSTPPATTGSTSAPPPKAVPLIVLNNSTVTGLAQRAAQEFTSGGWTVTSYANYTNDIISTCAYYDPATPGAQAAATALQAQFPAIKRVKARFSELPAGPVVVVLTSDFAQ